MITAIDFSKPRTTTRAMLDPTRLCALHCEFCYYLPNDDLHSVKPLEEQLKEVDAAVGRGCDSADLTGGEPLQNPHVVELVKYATSRGIFTRIITSLVCNEKTIDGVLNAGVADWLISMHGAKHETHNEIVHIKGARAMQEKRIAKIAARMDYCVNYVMVEKNQSEMAEWATWLVSRERMPKVANFINFNAFGPWLKSAEWIEKGKANVIDPAIAGPVLEEAIDILEEHGIGVNVRYAPMCMMAERHRKNICNDLHVAFDFGEWDNSFGARKPAAEVLRTYSIPLSNRNEEKGEPCSSCSHHGVCGGSNRIWHHLAREKFGREVLKPIDGPKVNDHWHYRKDNVMGLDPRRVIISPGVDAALT
jgi:organic radical activating enzyme